MTRDALARIWAVLGVFLAVYAFNAWSLSQGGPALGSVLLLDSRPTIACYQAVFVISFLLILLTGTGVLHARRSGGCWVNRIPLVGFSPETTSEIDRNDRAVAVYQAVCVLVIVVVPNVSLLRLNDEIRSAGVVWNKRDPSTVEALAHPADLLPWIGDDQIRAALLATSNRKAPSLRLANAEADARHAAACIKDRKVRSSPAESFGLPLHAQDAAQCNPPPRSANVTSACRDDSSECNGVDWYAYLSPALLFLFSVAAWTSSFYLLICFFRPKPADQDADGAAAI